MTNFEYYIAGGRANEGWTKFYFSHQNQKGETIIGEYNNWLLEEHKEPILDDVEKEYLSNVIKPFRDRVTSISKDKDRSKGYYIGIALIDSDYVFLPYFKESAKMYTGMELNHMYSLEELGL